MVDPYEAVSGGPAGPVAFPPPKSPSPRGRSVWQIGHCALKGVKPGLELRL